MVPKRDQVLIYHSRADDEWLERLKTHLRPLLPAGCQIFDDTQIEPGTENSEKLQEAMLRARVVVLLVSSDFLAAEFLPGKERLPLYASADPGGPAVLWLPLRPSSFAVTKIAAYPPLHDPAQPLSSLSRTDADAALVEISKRIRAAMDGRTVPGALALPLAATALPSHTRGFSSRQLRSRALLIGVVLLLSGAAGIWALWTREHSSHGDTYNLQHTPITADHGATVHIGPSTDDKHK